MVKLNSFVDLGEINCKAFYRNISAERLIQLSLEKEEGVLADNGALCVNTGKYTGRSPYDRFIVCEDAVKNYIDWNKTNIPISIEKFEGLYRKVLNYIKNKELYVFDGFVGSDKEYRMPLRVINEFAYQNLFAHQMLLKPTELELNEFEPDFTIISVPSLEAVPEIDGTNSEAFIIISFKKKLVLIGGTRYCGEIKKCIFSIMNYLLPFKGVLPMHCSANMGKEGDVALFFGLSGTGKTTLSTDDNRSLIGDDEHGWIGDRVFNFEGGCYAKCINLSRDNEPQIWDAIRDGALLENVVVNKKTGEPDYDDDKYTENTRVAFPIEHIDNSVPEGIGGMPKTIIFLTADATGTLPPISKLTKEQAMYHFISGYTSKLAGTERGIVEPQATFSACFGGPFMLLNPHTYAKLLGDKIDKYGVSVFLVNTGWTGGPYGVGERIELKYTRAMIRAALEGELDEVEYSLDPIFDLSVPSRCNGVPTELLTPQSTWLDTDKYFETANNLIKNFHNNFKQFKDIPRTITSAGPKLSEL